MSNKYQELTKGFFDEMETAVNECKKRINTALIVVGSFFGVFLISFVISMSKGSVSSINKFSAFVFIAGIITLFFAKTFDDDLKVLLRKKECDFYDNVFADIVAEELGGTADSFSYRNLEFNKEKASLGEILSSRDVTINGNVNNINFVYKQSKADVVVETITERDTKKVVSYKHRETKTDVLLEFETRKKPGVNIGLQPLKKYEKFGKNEKIKMDNDYFRFHVDCDDELMAYKFLTADVMEGLQELNNSSKIIKLNFSDNKGTADFEGKIKGMNLDYSPVFSKNMEKNRSKYCSDAVLEEAMKSVANIMFLMNKIPKCIA